MVHADLCRQNRILAAKHQEIIVDDAKTLELKCIELAEAIAASKCCMVYTGAGIEYFSLILTFFDFFLLITSFQFRYFNVRYAI